MASTASSSSNLIQFPKLPAVSSSPWDSTADKLFPPQPQPSRAGRTLKQSRSTESLTQRKDRVEFLRRREWTRRIAASGDQPVLPTVSSPLPASSLLRSQATLPCPWAAFPVQPARCRDADARAASTQQRRERTYSWEDIVAAADAAASTFDYNSSGYTGRPDTINETDEDEEPYVIYTASPRASYSSSSPTLFSLSAPSAYTAYTPHTPGATVIYSTSSPSHSPTLSPLSSPAAAVPSIGLGGPHHVRRASWRGPHSRHSSLSSISEEDEGLVRF
ncbi:hypothetical protein DICSQDRAFT_140344 [Dichomitus squalens LYAD-421 SS1]|uniref:Uncharacterized protein n=1 Tax=Dichomitus squalens (strain LYAD-421) TaxID=732165 RepID=R7SNZ1_DICSQ|nr:uncharacterized protein DICSQDRAFT_140344 [Dichomitus squalens LYAD-421 SS1]EJF57460.1 hypothetical protein DICSQDRAFT_140344 [Dichomitus squalens LYAD-421 SS1]